MERFQKLLVSLGHAADDADLIRYAAMLERLGTLREAHFVHVLPEHDEVAGVDDRDHRLAEIQGQVESLWSDAGSDIRTNVDVLRGTFLDRMLEFAAEQEVDLMLVGHDRDSENRRFPALRLAMKAPCSMWMIPAGFPPSIKRILVPVDFSPYAHDALLVAVTLARRLSEARVYPLYVRLHDVRMGAEQDQFGLQYDDRGQVPEGKEGEALAKFMEGIDCGAVPVEPLVERGARASAIILRTVQEVDADLVIMATRGRTRSSAILMGSVTERVLQEVPVPLLAVKHFGAQMRLVEVLLNRAFGRH